HRAGWDQCAVVEPGVRILVLPVVCRGRRRDCPAPGLARAGCIRRRAYMAPAHRLVLGLACGKPAVLRRSAPPALSRRLANERACASHGWRAGLRRHPPVSYLEA